MKHIGLRIGVGLLALSAAGVSLAQPAPTQRIAGTIERTDGQNIVVRPINGGGNFDIELTGNVAVFAVTKATLDDLKPGAFIGVGAMPQPDGSQRAIQVTVFAESQRGTGEGHRPWDRAPNSTMTNGTVDSTLKSVDGPVLTVKYKDGEKKIVVPPQADILAYSIADKSELKTGAHVAILRAKKKPSGGFEADRVNVGRGEIIPK